MPVQQVGQKLADLCANPVPVLIRQVRRRGARGLPQPAHAIGQDFRAELAIEQFYEDLTQDTLHEGEPLHINGRAIPAVDYSEGVAWFNFADLCDGPRAVADYIEIARDFHTVLVAHVPQFDATRDNAAKRFIHLVDEFYDRSVNLILSAEVPILELYAGDKLAAEFERTQSRLIEMQSAEYLARAHKP